MIKKSISIKNNLGLHARASMKLVDLASRYLSKITLTCGKHSCDAKNILDVMTLGATKGSKLEIKIEGPDQEEAMTIIESFFEKKCLEEEHEELF